MVSFIFQDFFAQVIYSIMLHTFSMTLYLMTMSFCYRLYILKKRVTTLSY